MFEGRFLKKGVPVLNTMDKKLLGVKINYIGIDQAVETVESWLKKRGKHFVVTPNPEMLIDASLDKEFLMALNSAELSIPDSSRLGWGSYIKDIANPFLRLILTPSFIYPKILPRFSFPTTTGVDLMERLLSLSNEKALTTAYLGGSKKVANKLFKCLRIKYPKLKIVFCSGNIRINQDGDIQFDTQNNKLIRSKDINIELRSMNNELRHQKGRADSFNMHVMTQKIDIMFVAFGHKKQEKWMYKNLRKLNTRVMIGVGGAFDYLSGEVPRAPEFMRNFGLEWLFRLIIQPWRIKRFWKLFYFIFKVVIGN